MAIKLLAIGLVCYLWGESAFSGWSGRMPNLLSRAELFYQNNFAHGAECWGGHLD
ncbi:MAG: hypothetical protein HN590_10685 [Calditrichaeota bacterium]|nr:hypothetical protein [Calditrichota bacterium]